MAQDPNLKHLEGLSTNQQRGKSAGPGGPDSRGAPLITGWGEKERNVERGGAAGRSGQVTG